MCFLSWQLLLKVFSLRICVLYSARDVLIWFWAFVDLNITILMEKTIQKFVSYYLAWTMRYLIVSEIKNVPVNFYKLRKIKHKRKKKILKIDKGNIRNLEILKYSILYYHTKTKWRSLCMLEPSIVEPSRCTYTIARLIFFRNLFISVMSFQNVLRSFVTELYFN